MAKNDRNNQKGKLGEIDVARSFVTRGCAVNFLAFMDVGMDLLVQMPANLKEPLKGAKSWEMSGRSVHVQVKSTNSDHLPSINVGTAQAWGIGTAAGMPTLLVGVVPLDNGKNDFRLFDPLEIDFLAHKAEANLYNTISIAVSKGELVDSSQLFQKVGYWLNNGPYVLSDSITRPWSVDPTKVWDLASQMVADLTLILERRFRAPEMEMKQTLVSTAEQLAAAFLYGAGLEPSTLHDRAVDRDQSYWDDLMVRVSETVSDGGSYKHGWSDWVPQLATVTSASDEAGAVQSLSETCTAYGRVVRGYLSMT